MYTLQELMDKTEPLDELRKAQELHPNQVFRTKYYYLLGWYIEIYSETLERENALNHCPANGWMTYKHCGYGDLNLKG